MPISHVGGMRQVFEGIPLAEMNTSMTINATAMWLLALYIAVADEQQADRAVRHRNDSERHPQGVLVARHLHLPARSLDAPHDRRNHVDAAQHSYVEPHQCLQLSPPGGRSGPRARGRARVANVVAVLDAVKATGEVSDSDFPRLVGRISFFCNSGIRYIEETCKMRAFGRLWDRITRKRYGVDNEKFRRFRYGLQVNSLGLTAAQPENNVYRIFLEMMAVTQSKSARARAVQLPAWNEALGLPCSWISSGPCEPSRYSPSRATCSSTTTSSRVRR